jgi:hypothetical protein
LLGRLLASPPLRVWFLSMGLVWFAGALLYLTDRLWMAFAIIYGGTTACLTCFVVWMAVDHLWHRG